MQIRLPTTSISGNSGQLSRQRSGLPMGISPCKLGTSIYRYSGQLSGQLSGQPTALKYGISGQFSGQPT